MRRRLQSGVKTGGRTRGLRSLTVDAPVSLDKRRKALGWDKLGEIMDQHQVHIAGYASDKIKRVEKTVNFNVRFIDANQQRYSHLVVPHFTYGEVWEPADPAARNPVGPVAVCVGVVEWLYDDVRCINGCKISIGTHEPGAVVPVKFDGNVHLTFQGYGAPIDETDGQDP